MGIFDPPKPVDSTPRENPKAGLYPARFVWLIDLGTTMEPVYQKPDEFKPKHQLLLGFELSGAKMSDGRPFMVSEKFTITNGQWGPYCAKTSRLHDVLKSWQGWDDKQIAKLNRIPPLLGSPCFVQVQLNESKSNPGSFWSKIANIMPLPEGMKVEDQVNECKTFACSAGADLADAPPFLHERIQASFEYKGQTVPKPSSNNEDIPF